MRSLLFMILILCTILFVGCEDDKDSTTGPIETPAIEIVILMDGVPADTAYVTNDNNGDIYAAYYNNVYVGWFQVELRGSNETTYLFHVIAGKQDCYSIMRSENQGGRIELDYMTDFEACPPDLNCGVIFTTSEEDGLLIGVLENYDLILKEDNIPIGVLSTDSEGRFATDIDSGYYIASMDDENYDYTFNDCSFHLQGCYDDYRLPVAVVVDYKPNIYLYPTETTTLDVNIEFPHGGSVTVSDPGYPEQWQNIVVDPDGSIDGQFGYLYYESETPDFTQKSAGWVIAQGDLERFFCDNLRQTGFNQTEINDFIEWWIPRLTDSEYYAIYPQYNAQIDPYIALNISQQPDNLIRLHYYVDSIESNDLELVEPIIPKFERTGFVVAEWGLIPSKTTEAILSYK